MNKQEMLDYKDKL